MFANMNKEIFELADNIGKKLLHRAGAIVTAESCTGGGIATALTDVAGSSAWFEQGFITYSNRAKSQLLAVEEALIERDGAVSESVVAAMLDGALVLSGATLGVAVSGIAGPSGGIEGKPIGTVCFAWGGRGDIQTCLCVFDGSRDDVRKAAIRRALQLCLSWLNASDTKSTV